MEVVMAKLKKKDYRYELRLSKSEKEHLEQQAKRLGIKMSEYMLTSIWRTSDINIAHLLVECRELINKCREGNINENDISCFEDTYKKIIENTNC